MQEIASLSNVAPQVDTQVLYPVQFAPVDVPPGPQPPFHDCSLVRRILSEVSKAVTFTNTNVDLYNTGRVQLLTI